MKKLLFILLLISGSIYAQTDTGEEQVFDYGIKNNAAQTVTSATYITTTGATGTQGKMLPANLPVSTQTQIAIDGKVSDTIRNGINSIAPSENAVYDALQEIDLQSAYNKENTITTSTGLGAVALKRGSAADTDNVLVVQNGSGSDTFTVKGNGDITGGLYNSYTPANDVNVVHLSGNETLSGIKSFTSAPRFDLGASFKSPSTVYQTINALNDGWALGVGSVSQSLIFNTSTNYAYTFPSATGTIALTSDLGSYATLGTTQTITGNKTFTGQNTFTAASSSTAITVTASTSGNGITVNNNSNGNGFTVNNNSTGVGEIINSATASTSDLTRWQKNGVTTSKVDHNGNITGVSFIKSGGLSTEYLKADGSVSTLTNPITGTLTSGYIPKATGANSLGNSLVYDNGTNVGIGTTNPQTTLDVTGNIRANGANVIVDYSVNVGGIQWGLNPYLHGIANAGFEIRDLTNSVTNFAIRGGNILLGTTTDDGVNKLQVNGSGKFSTGVNIGDSESYSFGGASVKVIGNAAANVMDIQTNNTSALFLSATQVPRFTALAGTGTRMVTADSSGNLSTDSTTYAPLASPALTGTPTAPTATAGTNTTQIATTAFVQTATRPYKSYTALLTQAGTAAPTAVVLENTLGTVTFGYTSAGSYTATSSSLFTSNKTTVFTQELFGLDSKAFEQITGVSNINLYTSSGGAYINGLYSATLIEIRVYN